jgi:mannose-1-phosphate guanylyltransferase
VKAFPLAAGKGERRWPLTNSVLCRRHHIDEVLVNTHSHTQQLVSYLNEHSYGLKVDIRHEETLLGSAGTLLANRNWIGGERDFWVFYADILTNANITQMLAFHRSAKLVATMGVCRVGNPRECGVVAVDEKHVVQDFVEKPEHPSNI